MFYGVSVLDIMANIPGVPRRAAAAINAGRGEVYTGSFSRKGQLAIPEGDFRIIQEVEYIDSIGDAAGVVLAKDKVIAEKAAEREKEVVVVEHIDMKVFNEIIMVKKDEISRESGFLIAPIYIREAEALTKLREKNKREEKGE
jgi:tRNA A37 threonylcarbamoyladenosine modification protein TsaB